MASRAVESRELEAELRRRLATGELSLPDPASGHTGERHRRLLDLGRDDLQIARMAEAHTDAVSILHEAGRQESSGVLYGVWAAEDPTCRLDFAAATRHPGPVVLTGTKAFCTGGTIVDRALVTVRHAGSAYLIDLDVRQPQVSFDECRWRTPAFAATATSIAMFDAVWVPAEDIIGPPGWYLERAGFWHGACGPAACWAGGAIGLVDHAVGCAVNKSADPHRDAQIGALAALRWQLYVMVDAAGREVDLDRCDTLSAMRRALMLRHNVERAATAVVDLFGRALGPRPLIQDADVVRRVAELQLYIRQHHDEHDLESIGRDLRGVAID